MRSVLVRVQLPGICRFCSYSHRRLGVWVFPAVRPSQRSGWEKNPKLLNIWDGALPALPRAELCVFAFDPPELLYTLRVCTAVSSARDLPDGGWVVVGGESFG